MNRLIPFFSCININKYQQILFPCLSNRSCAVRLCKSYGDVMFDNKRNTKKCDIRFQAISMYLKLARLQRIKREEYSTVKVCNLVFLCVGSNSYRYIHLSNIALLLGAESYNRPFFSFWG